MSNYLYASDEVVELREHILQELCKEIKATYKIEDGKTVIWYEAIEKIVQIPKYKSGLVYIDSLELIPSDNGWVIKIYEPFDPSKTAKDWSSFFDNKKDKVEILIKTKDKNLSIGVIILYGKFANKEIITGLKRYKSKTHNKTMQGILNSGQKTTTVQNP